jgi:hypothetical protein
MPDGLRWQLDWRAAHQILAEVFMTKDDFHEREPLNIIMRYKAERTTIAEAAAEIRAYVAECMRRAAEPPCAHPWVEPETGRCLGCGNTVNRGAEPK